MSQPLPVLKHRPAALVFDLDGTLVDSRRDITTALNEVRAYYHLLPLTLDQVVGMVGEGARRLIERAIGKDLPRSGAGSAGSAGSNIDAALHRYLAIYDDILLQSTQAYPGVPEMLAALAAVYPLALLSNKGENPSRRILEGLGLASHFQVILGGDSLPTRKPDPAGLHLAAQRLGVPAAAVALIGDTRVDALTAQAAGCAFILVEWGFPRPPEVPEMTEVAADLRATTPAEVCTALLTV